MPVYVGMRNWHPFIADTLRQMASDNVGQAVAVCLAPHNSRTSVGLYKQVLLGEDAPFAIDFVEEWHDHPLLIEAFAEKLRAGWTAACAEHGAKLPVLFTAHSVPTAHHRGRRSLRSPDARDRCTGCRDASRRSANGASPSKARACRAASGWDRPSKTPSKLRDAGHTGVFVQPIGFVCDHVEILFDIDILFRQFAAERGMKLYRAESLNDSPTFAKAVADIVRTRLAATGDWRRERWRRRRCSSLLMKRIAIIGGGISGLSAAFIWKRPAPPAPTSHTPYSKAASGWAARCSSDRVDGCLVEAGPDSFLTEKPWALTLCKELGIDDQLIGSNDAQRKTYIVVKGKLVAMPDGLMFMVPTKLIPTALSSLFSWETKLRMARELLHPPRPMKDDETVGELVERHFGAEVVDRLADPLLSGVYGGDANKLSARAVLPRFVEMEEKYGSLSRAMLAAHNKMRAMAGKTAAAATVQLAERRHAADGRCRRGAPRSSVDSHA